MKKVYPSEQIAHLWAHQTQSEARNPQNNLYFHGDTIYSYGSHFPIARHVTNKRKEKAVLFTTDTYGNTTSGHVSAVRGAISHIENVFHVPGDGMQDDSKAARKEALVDYQYRIVQLLTRAKKARSNGPRLLQDAKELLENANAYSAFFSLRKTFGTPTNFDKLVTQAEETKRKADKANAKRIAKEKAAQAIRDVTDRAEALKKLDAWLAGEGTSTDLHYRTREFFPAPMLRVKRVDCDFETQTSLGVSVPLSHAQRVYRAVKACKDTATAWASNGEQMPVGVFHVDRIDADGTLHAGCHHIQWPEIERLAIAQGW